MSLYVRICKGSQSGHLKPVLTIAYLRLAQYAIYGYHLPMIVSFRHKGLRRFFERGDTSGIQKAHEKRLRARLALMHSAQSVDELNQPGWRLHRLSGQLAGRWSITVSGNWRLTFEADSEKFSILDYEDYH